MSNQPDMSPEERAGSKIRDLLTFMETCHICQGTLCLDDGPVHCENCSSDCDEHDQPDCLSMERFHIDASIELTQIQDALDAKDREIARLRDALKPFAFFAEQWERRPLRGIADELYGIHAGTEFEAGIRLADCRKAREALANPGAGESDPSCK